MKDYCEKKRREDEMRVCTHTVLLHSVLDYFFDQYMGGRYL